MLNPFRSKSSNKSSFRADDDDEKNKGGRSACRRPTTTLSLLEELEESIENVRQVLEATREARRVQQEEAKVELQTANYHLGKIHNQWTMKLFKNHKRIPINSYLDALEVQSHHSYLVPQRVATQQAQLCRSLHYMELYDRQLNFISKHHEYLVLLTQAQMVTMQEEVEEVETHLMNALLKTDADVRMMKEELDRLAKEGKQQHQYHNHEPVDWQSSLNQSLGLLVLEEVVEGDEEEKGEDDMKDNTQDETEATGSSTKGKKWKREEGHGRARRRWVGPGSGPSQASEEGESKTPPDDGKGNSSNNNNNNNVVKSIKNLWALSTRALSPKTAKSTMMIGQKQQQQSANNDELLKDESIASAMDEILSLSKAGDDDMMMHHQASSSTTVRMEDDSSTTAPPMEDDKEDEEDNDVDDGDITTTHPSKTKDENDEEEAERRRRSFHRQQSLQMIISAQ